MHLDAAQVTHGMKRPLVKTAAQLFRKICYDNKDRLMAGIICAGWDEHKGGQVYAVTLGGTTVRQAVSFEFRTRRAPPSLLPLTALHHQHKTKQNKTYFA